MRPAQPFSRLFTTVAVVCLLGGFTQGIAQSGDEAPSYEVDPAWPKPLPNNWLVGAVVGVAIDSQDHVWIVHRPATLQPNETRSIWRAAPPVIEFDSEGNVVSAWGGAGEGYDWPDLEHGIHVDEDDYVWLGGGGADDAQILKFTRDGDFVMQIGRKGQNGGSNDTQNLGGAAHMIVDHETDGFPFLYLKGLRLVVVVEHVDLDGSRHLARVTGFADFGLLSMAVAACATRLHRCLGYSDPNYSKERNGGAK